MTNDKNKKKEQKKDLREKKDVLAEYTAQTKEDENIHFNHIDYVYSDCSCCC